jgi:hypothetical protein
VQSEARVRRWWARWRGDREAADLFGRLAALAGDFLQGRRRQARRRLDRAVRGR